MSIQVSTTTNFDLLGFLALQGFEVEVLSDNVWRVSREEELPVFLSHDSETGVLYFEVDIGPLNEVLDSQDGGLNSNLLQTFLDLNTEVLPVSFGINSTDQSDPRIVLVESRVTGDLSDDEVLSVFTALELATDRAENLLINAG